MMAALSFGVETWLNSQAFKVVKRNAGHDDGSIRLWNLETGTTVDLAQHTNTVTCLVMAPVSTVDELLFSAGQTPFRSFVCQLMFFKLFLKLFLKLQDL